MTTTVRSVRVELEASIASYVRDMRLAGHETDRAFSGIETRVTAANRGITGLDRSTAGLAKSSAEARVQQTQLASKIDNVARSTSRAESSIDRYSGRLRLLTDAALVLGPALVPLGGVAVAGVVTLAAQLGSLAGGLGVTLLATNGLADGLKALNDYQLDPTAANAENLRQELDKLGPSGERFVRFLDSIEPDLRSLQTAARDGLLPGAEEGIEHLLTILPQLRQLVSSFSTEVGDLMSDAGASLAGDDFEAFLNYLETDGVGILDDTARTLGNLARVAGNLFVAFGPLTGDISGGLLDWSEDLADASERLESSAGFQEFLDYIQSTGPQALDTLGSIANAMLQIVEAVAPLGGPALVALEGVADAIARIADSPLGTPIFAALAGLTLVNRALLVTEKLTASTFGGPAIGRMKTYVGGLLQVTSAQERAQMTATQLDNANRRLNGSWAGLAQGAGQVGLLALSLSGLADKAGLANAATLSLFGPWGTLVGAALDLQAANKGLEETFDALDAAMSSNDVGELTSALESANAQLEKMQANTVLGTSFLGDFAGGIINTIAPLSNVDKFVGLFGDRTGDLEDKAAAAEEKLAEMRSTTESTTPAVSQFARALEDSGEAASLEAQALEASIDAMREKRREALRALDAELNYQESIDDARKALKENGKTVDETTEKGRANLRALYALADGWNQQSDAAKNARGSLRQARQNFIETATAMGMARGEAKRLADQLFEIPPKRQTQIDIETAAAEANLRRVQGILGSLNDKTIHVRVLRYSESAGGPGAVGEAKADGGTVMGPRHPYGDKVLAYLAPGEEVISNRHGQADRFRADRAAGRIPAYADGGTTPGGFATYTSRMRGDAAWANLDKAAHGAAESLKSLKTQAEKLERTEDKIRARRDRLQSQYDDIVSRTTQQLRSNIFDTGDQDPWSSTAAMEPFSILESDIENATLQRQLIRQLRRRGLSREILDAITAEGGLAGLQQVASYSAADLTRFQQLFTQREHLVGVAAKDTAAAVVGNKLDATNARLDKVHDRLRDVERAIKAADGNNQKAQHESSSNFASAVRGEAGKGKRRQVYSGSGWGD